MSKMKDEQKKDQVYHLSVPNTSWFTAYPAQMLPIVSSDTLAAGWPRWSCEWSVCEWSVWLWSTLCSSSSCVWFFPPHGSSWWRSVQQQRSSNALQRLQVYFLVCAIGGDIISFSATDSLDLFSSCSRNLNKSFTMKSSWKMEHMDFWLQLFYEVFNGTEHASQKCLALQKNILMTGFKISPKNENTDIIYSPLSSSQPVRLFLSFFYGTRKKNFEESW